MSKLESFDKDSIIIGLESTAHYSNNLVRYLVAEFYKVCVLNPIKTSQMRKNNIRKTKTDKVDAYVIAKTLMMLNCFYCNSKFPASQNSHFSCN
ncbi:IS110 family transposase [Faecalimonas sp.]